MISRSNEIEIINKLCMQNETKLTVIHGRRRIGKTYLVNHIFKEKSEECIFFEFTGSDSIDNNTQKLNFLESIYDWFGVETDKSFDSWTELFIFLKRTIQNSIKMNPTKKIVLFFDEVSWIDKNNKFNFLSSFGHFYNTFCIPQNNFVVILCGSNASWIKNKIFKDSKGPLYHRVDVEIAMKPFTLKETKEYLLKEKKFNLDNKTIVDIYMILGGVAKYLNYLDASLCIYENIDNLFFKLDSPLYNEFNTVFKSLFYDKNNYHKDIVYQLTQKISGLTALELANILEPDKEDSSHKLLRKNIDELIDTGFIKAINKLHNKTKDTKYIISDPLSIFYNKWVKPLSKNDLSLSKNHFLKIINSQGYKIWSGFMFELVMINNIELYLQPRGISGIYKNIGYWKYVSKNEDEKGAQIDIVIEYENNIYDLIECKYYDDKVVLSKDDVSNIKNKLLKFKEYGIKSKRYDLKLNFITTNGIEINSNFHNLNISHSFDLTDLL